MSRNRILTMVGSVVVMALVTTACTGSPQPAGTQSGTTSTSPAASPTSEASGTASPEPTEPPQTPVSPPARSASPTAVAQSTKPAVRLTQPAKTSGLTIKVTGIKAIESEARGPGEVSSPALRVNVRLTNGTKEGFDATSVLVTLLDSKGDPGDSMLGPPFKRFKGVVKPGKSANSVWVFNVPKNRRQPVRIMVTLPTNDPVLLFRGNAPS